MMELQPFIDDLRVCRTNMLHVLSSVDQSLWQTIPEGYSNNLLWNIGHVVVTQQLLCYRMANVDTVVTDEIINKYRKGTVPPKHINSTEADSLKALMLSMVDQTEKDLKSGLFEGRAYKIYETSFGINLHSHADAIRFNNIHEGLHLGYMMAIRKSLSAQR